MIHLQSVSLPRIPSAEADHFPFTVPVVRSLPMLSFTMPVTFFVGENGSGKSTFMEAVASAANSIAVGSDELDRDSSLANVRKLGKALKLTWTKRTRNGFFLRAEDYFGYAKRLARIRQELEQEVKEIDEEYKDRSAYAQGLARMAHMGQLHALRTQYDGDLDERSHGESFFTFFKARFQPNGLYLLDEPEAPLSPLRQLAFLSLLKEMVEQHNAQFIIATHSPILMAYPDAVIFNFDQTPISSVAYNDLQHVSLTRDFLNNPHAFISHL
jgi:predicted ATPase